MYGDQKSTACGNVVQAQLLGFSANSSSYVRRAAYRLGIATFYLSRLAWGSVMSWLAVGFDAKLFTPVCMIKQVLQDETPLKMRDTSGTSAGKQDSERCLVKVVQTESLCSFIVQDEATGEYRVVQAEFPTSLHKVETGTGVALKHVVEVTMEAPLQHAVCSKFPLQVDLVGGDRAATNLKMDKLCADERPGVPRLSTGCQIHMLHTVCGSVLDISKVTVSGVIGLALAQTASGAVRQFRLAIAQVLKVVVAPGLPAPW